MWIFPCTGNCSAVQEWGYNASGVTGRRGCILCCPERFITQGETEKGIEEIALGNMEYQIPLQGLRGENLKLAEMINGIANGFHMAVEEAMKMSVLRRI